MIIYRTDLNADLENLGSSGVHKYTTHLPRLKAFALFGTNKEDKLTSQHNSIYTTHNKLGILENCNFAHLPTHHCFTAKNEKNAI